MAWDLGPEVWPYPEALPVLMEHFENGEYPDDTMERIGNALGVRAAVGYWDRVRACYVNPRGWGQEEGAAHALSGMAGPAQLVDLVDLLDVAHQGRSRIFLLRSIRRLGRQKVQRLLESLRSDPVLGVEATAILKGRGVND